MDMLKSLGEVAVRSVLSEPARLHLHEVSLNALGALDKDVHAPIFVDHLTTSARPRVRLAAQALLLKCAAASLAPHAGAFRAMLGQPSELTRRLAVELLGALDKSARAPHRDALRDAANRDESSAVRGAAFTVLEADDQFVLAGEDEGKTGPQFTMGASSPRRSLSPNASLGRSRAQRSIARSKQRHKSPELRKSAAEWAQKMTPSPPPSRDGEAAAATAASPVESHEL